MLAQHGSDKPARASTNRLGQNVLCPREPIPLRRFVRQAAQLLHVSRPIFVGLPHRSVRWHCASSLDLCDSVVARCGHTSRLGTLGVSAPALDRPPAGPRHPYPFQHSDAHHRPALFGTNQVCLCRWPGLWVAVIWADPAVFARGARTRHLHMQTAVGLAPFI